MIHSTQTQKKRYPSNRTETTIRSRLETKSNKETTRIEKSRSSNKASSEEQLGGDNREALAGGDQVVKQQ